MKLKSNEKNYVLDNQVDDFITWYKKNMVKRKYTDIGEYSKPKDLKNFIEKMAAWYELRYPEEVIDSLLLDKDYNTKENWSKEFNIDIFKQLLSSDESFYLNDPAYEDKVYLSKKDNAYFTLTKDGYIESCENIYRIDIFKGQETKLVRLNEKFIGKNIKDVHDIALSLSLFTSSNDCEIDEAINDYEKQVYFKEKLLDCVMYRLIERGGTRTGAKRAFLFAKEFKRDIEIPLIYGIDLSDPDLLKFINIYLENGGKEDITCFLGYGSRTSKYEKLDTMLLKEIIDLKRNNMKEKIKK